MHAVLVTKEVVIAAKNMKSTSLCKVKKLLWLNKHYENKDDNMN